MTIFESLRKDHDIQRKLLEQLVETSGNTEDRKRIYYQLKHELEIHADAEERFFYKPLFDDDLTQDRARHSVAEHQEIDHLIEKLDDTDMDSSTWLTYAKELHHKVGHHLDEEEYEVFQLAGKSLNNSDKENLAKAYLDYMSENRDIKLRA